MPEGKYPATDIKIFAALGVVGLALLTVAAGLLVYGAFELQRKTSCESRSSKDPGCAPGPLWGVLDGIQKEVETETETPSVESFEAPGAAPGLGDEGAACGGPARLPCKPGMTCQKEAGASLGVCVSVSAP
ncbi:hypothetical protein HY479_03710 [Candidatus Uhrbacteria bacterium]|nr:hypothetical protein [Candidatus Uhrbacteria bacterium]